MVCWRSTSTAPSAVAACLAILIARTTIVITMIAAIATTTIPIAIPICHWVAPAISGYTRHRPRTEPLRRPASAPP